MEIDFSEGSIWEIFFYTKEKIALSEKQNEAFVEKQTRELVNTFDPPPGMDPQTYSALFLHHFMKSREKSREELEKSTERQFRYRTLVQVGNRECVEDLEKTEKADNFFRWEDPFTVETFIKISKEYLHAKEKASRDGF